MKKIIAVMLCLTALVFTLAGCSEKKPPPLGEIAVDLAEDVVDGKWDAWLEVWKAGDRSDVYKARFQFNVFSNNGCGFSIYTKKTDKSPERFADLTGIQPLDVAANVYGYVSAAKRDVINIWFEDKAEYTFQIRLTKNDDGCMTGSGSIEVEGGTAVTLYIVQWSKWTMGDNGGLLALPSDME